MYNEFASLKKEEYTVDPLLKYIIASVVKISETGEARTFLVTEDDARG